MDAKLVHLMVIGELEKAQEKFRPFASNHEGFAVIQEELDELWCEIKKQGPYGTNENMHHEGVQLAAMALRFLIDRT